jgi:phosphoserine phosphatase RsbU/P
VATGGSANARLTRFWSREAPNLPSSPISAQLRRWFSTLDAVPGPNSCVCRAATEDTAAALGLLNKRLRVRPVPGRYSSMIYALFDPASGVLTFSNAGVPLPLLVSTEGCRSLGEGGFPSRKFADAAYEIHSVQLSPGDAVLFATDGLHEMRNAQNQDLSWGKLEETWKQCRCKSADDCLDFLFDQVREFSASSGSHDDITAVVLKEPL